MTRSLCSKRRVPSPSDASRCVCVCVCAATAVDYVACVDNCVRLTPPMALVCFVLALYVRSPVAGCLTTATRVWVRWQAKDQIFAALK